MANNRADESLSLEGRRAADATSAPPRLTALTPDEVSARLRPPAGRPHVSQRGIPAVAGIAIGTVHLHQYSRIAVKERRIAAGQVDAEIAAFERAIRKSKEEVAFLRESVAQELGEDSARIFDAQLLFFEDVMVIDGTIRDVRSEHLNVAAVFRRNVNRMIQRLTDADSDYLRERASDFQDAKRRVLRHLLEINVRRRSEHGAGTILVAHDLAPSEAAALDASQIVGLVTEGGTLTSHAAIMARTKGIPAVVGVTGFSRYVRNGDIAAIDGLTGSVEVNPPQTTLHDLLRRLNAFEAHVSELSDLRGEEAVTTDGHRIELAANIESPDDVGRVLDLGADGVGLYRTEFFYIERARMPSEVEQAEAYSRVAERLQPKFVNIRSMDVGGDKVASYLGTERESNPFLGWRGIRFSLERSDVFRIQLRAIFRASRFENVRLMLPMITSIEELRRARRIVDEVRAELVGEQVEIAPSVDVGIMIETPAAVIMADQLAAECDFFSVGSNDLIQYSLAVDRTNPKIAHMYEPLHPAILRSLKSVVQAAKRHEIWVGLCGEMAADPLAAVLLVGLGFDELSVSPYSVPELKKLIRAISYREACEVVEDVWRLDTGAEVRERLRERVGTRLSQFFSL